MATFRPKSHSTTRDYSSRPDRDDSRATTGPMGDDRFRELMAALSVSFAQADGGREVRARMREREREREVWLAERTAAIEYIVKTMQLFRLSPDDLA